MRIYVPLVSMLLVSLALTVALYLARRLFYIACNGRLSEVVMVRSKLIALVVASAVAAGCTTAETDGAGLTGTVLRGPTQPVCTIGVPCDEPFAALFHVTSGGREVAQFRSDTDGRFSIALPAGSYTIIPDASAPLMAPTSQTRTVQVQSHTVTQVQLDFDTGIR